ncbi:MAG: hypothetical protein J3K34DRAFT_404612 [Monoraphidium minutum]|nr:MAG: hypothetical protein J3K34DRAFT_404612 [Monoraphidium minutum]
MGAPGSPHPSGWPLGCAQGAGGRVRAARAFGPGRGPRPCAAALCWGRVHRPCAAARCRAPPLLLALVLTLASLWTPASGPLAGAPAGLGAGPVRAAAAPRALVGVAAPGPPGSCSVRMRLLCPLWAVWSLTRDGRGGGWGPAVPDSALVPRAPPLRRARRLAPPGLCAAPPWLVRRARPPLACALPPAAAAAPCAWVEAPARESPWPRLAAGASAGPAPFGGAGELGSAAPARVVAAPRAPPPGSFAAGAPPPAPPVGAAAALTGPLAAVTLVLAVARALRSGRPGVPQGALRVRPAGGSRPGRAARPPTRRPCGVMPPGDPPCFARVPPAARSRPPPLRRPRLRGRPSRLARSRAGPAWDSPPPPAHVIQGRRPAGAPVPHRTLGALFLRDVRRG